MSEHSEPLIQANCAHSDVTASVGRSFGRSLMGGHGYYSLAHGPACVSTCAASLPWCCRAVLLGINTPYSLGCPQPVRARWRLPL